MSRMINEMVAWVGYRMGIVGLVGEEEAWVESEEVVENQLG